MTGPSMSDYTVGTAVASGCREAMLALWQHGLDDEVRAARKYDWYYRRHPEDDPLVAFLRHAGEREPVGVAAAGTRRMRYGDRTLRAGTMVDFVVREDHRTLFPAIALQKAICRRALEDHELLYGIPNPHSLAVTRRSGYRQVGSMVRRVRVLRTAPFLARHLPALPSRLAGALVDRLLLAAEAVRRLAAPSLRTRWVDRPDGKFDDLWSRAAPAGLLMGVRDRRYLCWRFVDVPFGACRFFTVTSGPEERLVAYAACDSRGDHLQVQDFLVDPACRGAAMRLWSDLARDAYREGHVSYELAFMGARSLQRDLAAAGLLARERQPVLAVLPEALTELADESRWYLTHADDDA